MLLTVGFGFQLVMAAPGAKEAPSMEIHENLCGAYSLFIAFRLLNHPISYNELLNVVQPSHKGGISLSELENFSRSKGLYTRALKLSANEIAAFKTPVICMDHFVTPVGTIVKKNHYFIMRGIGRNFVQIIDAPNDPYEFKLSGEHREQKKLVTLLLSNTPISTWQILTPGWIKMMGVSGVAFLISGFWLCWKAYRAK